MGADRETFFKVLERQNMQNQTISELYTDDNKSKYSSNPKDIPKSAKKFYEKLYTMETTSEAPTTEFLGKIPDRKKISNEQCHICDAKISLDENIKPINSQANNKSPGNYGLTAEIHIHFSNELSPVLLDVYDSWGKFGTIGITSRAGIVPYIKKVMKKILRTTYPHTTILKNRLQKILDTIMGKNQSPAIKK